MINKETAFKIALRVIPDLEKRSYKITDGKTVNGLSPGLPADCWHVIYSSVILNYSACGTGKTLHLYIDKETGGIKK